MSGARNVTIGNVHFRVSIYLHENLTRQLGNGGQRRQSIPTVKEN